MLDLECEQCGAAFKRYPSQIKRMKHYFCSRRCHTESMRIVEFSHDDLRREIHYDQDTGAFTRRSDGVQLGYVHRQLGYVFLHVGGKIWLGHRLAWLYMTGEIPSGQIDHDNRDRADNRWKNLRLATISQQRANRICKGYTFHKARRKYVVNIKREGVNYHVGYFDTPEEAQLAYRRKHVQVFGEFSPYA